MPSSSSATTDLRRKDRIDVAGSDTGRPATDAGPSGLPGGHRRTDAGCAQNDTRAWLPAAKLVGEGARDPVVLPEIVLRPPS